MRQLFLFLIALFTSGCIPHAKVYELNPCTKLLSPNISLNTPSSASTIPWKTFDSPTDIGVRDWFNIWHQIPNMMSENVRITVRTIPQNQITNHNYNLMDRKKSDSLEKTLPTQLLTGWERKNHSERGVSYSKGYMDYIAGLRCQTTVESSNIALGIGTKSYQTFCNYYDTQDQLKELWTMYSYTYSYVGTKFESDSSSSIYSPQAMQSQFKQDMKAIFDSLVIHDMDRERMAKEGLLHDRKYDIESEFQ